MSHNNTTKEKLTRYMWDAWCMHQLLCEDCLSAVIIDMHAFIINETTRHNTKKKKLTFWWARLGSDCVHMVFLERAGLWLLCDNSLNIRIADSDKDQEQWQDMKNPLTGWGDSIMWPTDWKKALLLQIGIGISDDCLEIKTYIGKSPINFWDGCTPFDAETGRICDTKQRKM